MEIFWNFGIFFQNRRFQTFATIVPLCYFCLFKSDLTQYLCWRCFYFEARTNHKSLYKIMKIDLVQSAISCFVTESGYVSISLVEKQKQNWD